MDTSDHRKQLKDRAYEFLRDAISSLDLPPGEHLREVDIGRQLGMSKTPVREAFARLAAESLVDVVPYRGAVVRGYSEDDLRQIFELREIVEGFAARQAAEAQDPAVRDRLVSNVEDSESALLSDDHPRLSALVSEFDELMYQQTTNSRVKALLSQLRCHIERIGRLSEDLPGRLAQSVAQHALIVDAIVDGDGAEAEARMRAHVRSVRHDQLRDASS